MAEQRGVPGTDVVRQAGGLSKFLASYTGNLSRIVPEHVPIDAFIGLAAAAVNRDPKLTNAAMKNPASLVFALRHCASLGHLPVRGTYALVPFNNRSAVGGVEVVGIEEWRGVVERMFRAGGVVSVHAELVRQNDVFARGRFRELPHHEYDWQATADERGPLIGVYAWANLLSGHLSDVVLLNRHEVQRYRAVSKSGDAFWGPSWPSEGPWTEAMWRKTGLHRLEGLVPTSAAYRWQLAASQAAATAPPAGSVVPERPVPVPGRDDIQDAEILDERASQDTEIRDNHPQGGTP